jgi:hypothetical protein
MAKIDGAQAVPAEILRKYGKALSIANSKHVVRKRFPFNLWNWRDKKFQRTNKQRNVRFIFKQCTKCFKRQPYDGGVTPPAIGPRSRTWWFDEAIESGLWYYDYFMQQSLNTYFSGIIPEWCRYNDDLTKLLLHCDKYGVATEILDSSLYNHVVEAKYGAHIKTNNYKFANGSLFFDGEDDYLEIEASTDWHFTNQDFTIEFWARFEAGIKEEQTLVALWKNDNRRSFKIWVKNNIEWHFTYSTNGINESDIIFYEIPTPHVWHHYAFVRSENNLIFFADGHVKDFFSLTATLHSPEIPLTIGRAANPLAGETLITPSPQRVMLRSDFDWPSAHDAEAADSIGGSAPLRIVAHHTYHTEEPNPSEVQIQRYFATFHSQDIQDGKIPDYVKLRINLRQYYNFENTGTPPNQYLAVLWHFRSNPNNNYTLGEYPNWEPPEIINEDQRLWLFEHEQLSPADFNYKYMTLNNTGLEKFDENGYINIAILMSMDYLDSDENGLGYEANLNADTRLIIGIMKNNCYKGWLDEIRISKGIARFTNEFTRPRKPYDDPTEPV